MRKRDGYFGMVAMGGLIVLFSVYLIVRSRIAPFQMIEDLGANVTPTDLSVAIQASMVGTAIGLLGIAIGILICVFCGLAISKDRQREREAASFLPTPPAHPGSVS